MFNEVQKGKYWDKPWSLVSGCTPCSPGCVHENGYVSCWALAMERRFHKGEEGKIVIHPERLDIPLRRRKRTVWALWNDLAHEDVEFSFFEKVIFVVKQSPMHIFLFLTKRPEQQAIFFKGISNYTSIPKNLWPGVTVCNQAEADQKIPILLQIPAAVRWVSLEPLLGPVDLKYSSFNGANSFGSLEGINWIVLGGETGPGARPMKLEWVRDVRDQCIAANLPFFFKAWGPRKEVGRIVDGREWNELPDLTRLGR